MNGRLLKVSFTGFVSPVSQKELCHLLLLQHINIISGYIVFSSPEHEVLMVSYCDQSMSVVRRQQFVLKANSS